MKNMYICKDTVLHIGHQYTIRWVRRSCACWKLERDHRNIKAKQRVTSGEKEPMRDSKQENGMTEMIRYSFSYANPGGNMDNRCSRGAHSEATATQDR